MTEPEYLLGLKRHLRIPGLVVDIIGAAGVPRTLVDEAVTRKHDSDRRRRKHPEDAYDEVWAVFDRDAHPFFAEACQKAQANAVGLAVSIPSFELWLLLHHQDQTAPLERHQAVAALAVHVPDADKHVDFARFAGGLDDACARARELDRRAREGATDGNPTTGVHSLVETLRPEAAGVQRG